MDPTTRRVLLSSSKKGDPVYVDDVFSTFLYEGNEGSHTINNGIDLSGEGGLVWVKRRNASERHSLFDTENGITKHLASNEDSAARTRNFVSSFNTNGFSFNSGDTEVNNLNDTYASWSFRKAPGFFDVVTYTGTGSARTIAHSLGSAPGMIIIKAISTSYDWRVYHRSLGKDYYGGLNSTMAFQPESGTGYIVWNNTEPTSSVFSVGTAPTVNANGVTYVAYIFAHDDAQFGTNGDESIIKCGSYTGNLAEQFIDLGFEPQFLLIKRSNGSADWKIFDNMRGWSAGAQERLYANTNEAGGSSSGDLTITSTGFREPGTSAAVTNIYIAIRRPHKPPEVGTDVFAMDTKGSTAPTPPAYNAPFPVDFAFLKSSNSSQIWRVSSRLTSGKRLEFDTNNSETSNGSQLYAFQYGFYNESGSDSTFYSWMFKRAPGFFDVVAYTGDGVSNRTVPSNLGVAAELAIVKRRDSAGGWLTYSKDIPSSDYLILNASQAPGSYPFFGTQTAAGLVLKNAAGGTCNGSGEDYLALLFATLPGISKVGSYTGTGSAQNIDCGFTTGARFVLIKRIDGSGSWYLFDTVRGITSGNDPYLTLNSSNAQITTQDKIDPHPSSIGFALEGDGDVNSNGESYIFLAIA